MGVVTYCIMFLNVIGITNADEYSLFIEQEKDDVMDEEEAEEARRGTLRKMVYHIYES